MSAPSNAPALRVPTPLDLDAADIKLLSGCLRTAYTWTCDALAACANAPYGYSKPRGEPKVEAADRNRAQLDRIERLARALGEPITSGRREDVERYFAQEVEKWHESVK